MIERLMAAGDAGSISSRVTERAWRDFVEHVAETLDIGSGTRIFEVGCRAGAFLYPLHENNFIVSGLDESPDCIGLARQVMPDSRFTIGPASALDPAEPWDVVACSILAAFPDLDYARGVIARMAAKSTHAIAILDVPDLESKGSDLDRLYFDRRWMLQALAEIGASAVQIEDLKVAGDADARFRYNVFARL